MQWEDVLGLSEIKLNIGGRGDYHGRRRGYEGWVAVGLKVGDGWAVEHQFPQQMGLPDRSVDAVLSEHFIEHLTDDDAVQTLRELHRAMKVGARIRVAVPDMLHPKYASSLAAGKDLVEPLHLSIWHRDTLSTALLMAGFGGIAPQHWWDRDGHFYCRSIDHSLGRIKRCPENDPRNKRRRKNLRWSPLYRELFITSLVVDATKLQTPRVGRIARRTIEWT